MPDASLPAMYATVSHRHLWAPEHLSPAELQALLQTAAALKGARHRDRHPRPLQGRHLALLCTGGSDAAGAFQRAVTDLGGTPVLLNADEWYGRVVGQTKVEARFLGRLYDALDCCNLPMAIVEQIESHSGLPVFNGFSSPEHPLSTIGDLLTMSEIAGKPLHKCRLAVVAHDPPGVDEAAAAVARLAGMHILGRDKADQADFVLDTAAPASAGRLTMPRGAPADQARLGERLETNRQFTLEAAIVCGLQ